MEPAEKLPSQNGVEQGRVEYGPPAEGASPEKRADSPVVESGAERFEQASEAAATSADSGFPATLPMPVMAAPTAADSPSAPPASSGMSPLVAADEDLIEKEWVDRAKKIVGDTKDDPYTQEEAVSGLKKEYKEKRYGRGLDAA